MRRAGVTRFVEMPPGRVLTRLLEGRGVEALGYDTPGARATCTTALCAPRPDLALERCLLAAAATPNRSLDPAAGERAVETYQRLQGLLERCEEQDRLPAADQVAEALDLLAVVFTAKDVTAEERQRRRQDIMSTVADVRRKGEDDDVR
jgi:hypothetical protein